MIDQSASRLETSAGNRLSQSSAPAARAVFRTTAGTSIIASVSHLQSGATPITRAAVDGQARSLRRAPDRSSTRLGWFARVSGHHWGRPIRS